MQFLFFLCALLSSSVYAAGSTLILDPLVVTTPRISDYYNATTDTATRTQASTLATPFSVGVVNQTLLQDSMVLRLEDAAIFSAACNKEYRKRNASGAVYDDPCVAVAVGRFDEVVALAEA